MKETSQTASSASLMPTAWPAKTVETLIFLRWRLIRSISMPSLEIDPTKAVTRGLLGTASPAIIRARTWRRAPSDRSEEPW